MKLRDITYEDLPNRVFAIYKYDPAAALCLSNGYLRGKDAFEKAKASIPSEKLDIEMPIEKEELE